MKKSLDITILLDKSGSMDSAKNETIRGFNNFVSMQKEINAQVNLTLITFNHNYHVEYDAIDIAEIPPLNTYNYIPDGLTALLDAIGHTIKSNKKRLKRNVPESIPSKVLFVIITDGLENNSIKFTREQIFRQIKKMEVKQQWEFVFLAANQDAISEASQYGIDARRAMTYAANKTGIEQIYFSLSENIQHVMEHQSTFQFTEEQRKKQPLQPNNNQ